VVPTTGPRSAAVGAPHFNGGAWSPALWDVSLMCPPEDRAGGGAAASVGIGLLARSGGKAPA
jgi:hypothetical protein